MWVSFPSFIHGYIKTIPGLEHATIKDNIIFGSPRGYDEDRYLAVIEACALIPDLDLLEAGDQTGDCTDLSKATQLIRPQKLARRVLLYLGDNGLA